MDILESALDEDDPHHIMCALPTGFGKSMPMLMLGHLLPPGAVCLISINNCDILTSLILEAVQILSFNEITDTCNEHIISDHFRIARKTLFMNC